MSKIKIGEKEYSRGWLLANPEKARNIYKSAKRQGLKPICLCQPQGIPMHFAERNEKCSLKRNRNSGPLHHKSCPSHANPEKYNHKIQNINAVEKTTDGDEKIFVDFNLKTVQKLEIPENCSVRKSKSNKKRDRFSLRQFFIYLWSQGGFCEWIPEQDEIPTYDRIITRIDKISEKVILKGKKLQNILIFPNNQEPDIYINTLSNICNIDKTGAKDKGIIIGLIDSIRKTKNAFIINLYRAPKNSAIFIQSNGYEKIKKAFASSLISEAGVFVTKETNECYWLIATITTNRPKQATRTFINIDAFSVIKTSRRYVPF